jgi:hypothetical protein
MAWETMNLCLGVHRSTQSHLRKAQQMRPRKQFEPPVLQGTVSAIGKQPPLLRCNEKQIGRLPMGAELSEENKRKVDGFPFPVC